MCSLGLDASNKSDMAYGGLCGFHGSIPMVQGKKVSSALAGLKYVLLTNTYWVGLTLKINQ